MSSYMRTLERGKIRSQMEAQNVTKKNKKLKVWWDAYKEEKRKYLEKLAERGYVMVTRKQYEQKIRRKNNA
ncbi:MAG: hypothetical protein J6U54_16050 [Clostridiales bacterium]|nr:hypothetical protein [Clostridiales bacterium]